MTESQTPDVPMKPIPMAGPWVTEHEVKVVMDAMTTGWYEKPYYYVETFQKEFAAYHGRKFALMTPNCTSAIHLLLTCLGVKPGDQVIVPECTWIATAAPINYLGAEPVFCDINADDWCLDPESVEKAITPKTKAIIAVDLFGNMAPLPRLKAIADKHGIPLVEDSAEALGSTLNGAKAGSFGVGSVFSFHRTKTLTTGEGGMLLLDDEELFRKCSIWRDHGRRPGGPMYYNFEVTYKYMPFNLQAALGYAQFQRLSELVARKRWIFQAYKDRLKDIEGLQFNAEPPGVVNSLWTTAIVFDPKLRMTKADAIEKLRRLGIPSRPFFYPLSSLPAYPGFEAKYKSRNPRAYDISNRGLNLSCAMNLTIEQIDDICKGIRTILGH